MISKYYLLSFCAISISFACVSAQNYCFRRISGLLTNGVHAELIHSDSGLLLGIRVSWSWLSSDPVECFQSPRVQLLSNVGVVIQKPLDSISRNNSVEFNSIDLDCNQMYSPTVRATLSNIGQFENGNEVFFGGFILSSLGSMRSPPVILPKVCVGSSTSPQHQGRVSISWDPLPCHLQNGADITSYIIQYTGLSTDVATRISSSQYVNHSHDLYSCVVAELLIPSNQAYSIQVAAQNNYGEGSFSDPINVSVPVFCMTCTYSADASDGVVSTTSGPTSSDNYAITIKPIASESDDYSAARAWTIMGSLVAILTLAAGLVISAQFIINYALWKRLKKLQKDKVVTTSLPQKSTQCEKIDMKECSAYGKVISPQPTASEQPHIYESTMQHD